MLSVSVLRASILVLRLDRLDVLPERLVAGLQDHDLIGLRLDLRSQLVELGFAAHAMIALSFAILFFPPLKKAKVSRVTNGLSQCGAWLLAGGRI